MGSGSNSGVPGDGMGVVRGALSWIAWGRMRQVSDVCSRERNMHFITEVQSLAKEARCWGLK